MKRTCPTCLGPKVAVPDRYTDAQVARIEEANGLLDRAALIERRKKVEPYYKKARELRAPCALNVYAELNGLCCRFRGIHGKNPDGTRWCTECKERFGWFSSAFENDNARNREDLSQPPQALRDDAQMIISSIVRPIRMVCKPGAEEKDNYEHFLVKQEEREAKRRRVD